MPAATQVAMVPAQPKSMSSGWAKTASTRCASVTGVAEGGKLTKTEPSPPAPVRAGHLPDCRATAHGWRRLLPARGQRLAVRPDPAGGSEPPTAGAQDEQRQLR